ncbi:MAG: hypothetical protein IJS90_05505 [Clostridia bacterium]|nr:hypothetical protein [Clostridia bacterium]
MKKIISIITVCLMSVIILASCGKKTEATKSVEGQIKGLADVQIGLDSEEAVSEIESAYNALSDEEKERVKNYDEFQSIKEELASVKTKAESFDKMNSSINDIVDAAKAGFSSADTDYSELISQGRQILDKYEELEDEDKESVKISEDFNKAMESLSSYVETAEKSTAEYVKAFNSVYAEENYEVTNVYCIMQIRDGVEYHVFALTYKDKDGNESNLYANARCSANTTAETIIANADSFFAKRAVSDDYNAVINANVALDVEKVLSLAK